MQSEEIEYTTGVDLGSKSDYTVVSYADGAFQKWTKDAPAKTGRRESARKVTMYEGPRQGKAAACGHSVVLHSQPSTKCFDCWHLYFSTNVKATFALFSFLRDGREAELVAVHGSKFVKMFKKYVNHVQSIAPIQAEDAHWLRRAWLNGN